MIFKSKNKTLRTMASIQLSWYFNNQFGFFHRDTNDKPTVIYFNGDKSFYTNGRLYKCINMEGKVFVV